MSSHTCIWCGGEQDHKCGLDACGDCCAMLGSLADDAALYRWATNTVRARLIREDKYE